MVVDEVHAAGEVALHHRDHAIEIVEGAQTGQPHRPAFGRSRIDVVEMLEAGGVAQIAEQREAVSPALFFGGYGIAQRAEAYSAQRRRRAGEEGILKDRSAGRLHQLAPRSGFGWRRYCDTR